VCNSVLVNKDIGRLVSFLPLELCSKGSTIIDSLKYIFLWYKILVIMVNFIFIYLFIYSFIYLFIYFFTLYQYRDVYFGKGSYRFSVTQ
jgi:hypothetical protein